MENLAQIRSARPARKQVVLISPRYPYGKDQIFLGGSLVTVAARLMAMGHMVTMIDFNIDRLTDKSVKVSLAKADMIGISLTGAPYIPGVVELLPALCQMAPRALVLLGGQVIERLSPEQFAQIFQGQAVQVKDDIDLARNLGCQVADLPDAYTVDFVSVWKQMGEGRLVRYLRHESALVISQGCHFKCRFCAADKDKEEQFRSLKCFRSELLYLTKVAKHHDISQLDFYATNLDFFQNPEKIRRFLEVLVQVQEETGVRVRVRCLSCLTSFLRASRLIPGFGELLKRAGLWCVGFGVDGTDEMVWRAQRKGHNRISDIQECLELSRRFGLRVELLMILGFPQDNWRTLGRAVLSSILGIAKWWPHVVIRPYLAKSVVPGNEGWQTELGTVEALIADPHLFYNLDFAAIGSPLTHPCWWQRLQCNAAYLAICALLIPIGRCATSPLLPQGQRGLYGRVAQLVNGWMRFDR